MHRWSMRVCQNKFNLRWDVAVVHRCDFVGISCSDAPCLTEGMQQRGVSSSSLLRSDGVGNHDAQTREKLLGWFPEKRPRKAWFSPLVIAHQINSTRCSLRTRQVFRMFFEYAAAVKQSGVLGIACKVCRLVFCRAARFWSSAEKLWSRIVHDSV